MNVEFEKKYKEWVEVNKRNHVQHKLIIASIRCNKSLAPRVRKTLIDQSNKEFRARFWKVRKHYLGY